MKFDRVNPYDLILEKAEGERIEAVVIGSFTMKMLKMLEMLGQKPIVEIPATKTGVPLTLEEARPLLDYEVEQFTMYHAPPLIAWTENWVISIALDCGHNVARLKSEALAEILLAQV